MKLFELLPCVDLPGQHGLAVVPSMEFAVKQVLSCLEQQS